MTLSGRKHETNINNGVLIIRHAGLALMLWRQSYYSFFFTREDKNRESFWTTSWSL